MKGGGGEKEKEREGKKKLEKAVLRPAGGRGSGCSAAPGRRLAAGGGIAPARCASLLSQGQAAQPGLWPGHHPTLRRGTTGEGLGETGVLNSPHCTETCGIPCLTLPFTD